jgi:hypothetical protein
MHQRVTPRIVPPQPVTVSVKEIVGSGATGYGVLADISKRGGCVHTDKELELAVVYEFHISFSNPPEVHDVLGEVVWAQDEAGGPGGGVRRYGVEWIDADRGFRSRLRDLASRAAPPDERESSLFEKPWTVPEDE